MNVIPTVPTCYYPVEPEPKRSGQENIATLNLAPCFFDPPMWTGLRSSRINLNLFPGQGLVHWMRTKVLKVEPYYGRERFELMPVLVCVLLPQPLSSKLCRAWERAGVFCLIVATLRPGAGGIVFSILYAMPLPHAVWPAGGRQGRPLQIKHDTNVESLLSWLSGRG